MEETKQERPSGISLFWQDVLVYLKLVAIVFVMYYVPLTIKFYSPVDISIAQFVETSLIFLGVTAFVLLGQLAISIFCRFIVDSFNWIPPIWLRAFLNLMPFLLFFWLAVETPESIFLGSGFLIIISAYMALYGDLRWRKPDVKREE